MPSIKDILKVLGSLNLGHKIGVAGSYAKGTQKLKSDIDIVVDTDLLEIADMELIKETLLFTFGKKSDIICLQLLRQEDEELDKLAISVGIEPNEDSAYKSILREVVWFNP